MLRPQFLTKLILCIALCAPLGLSATENNDCSSLLVSWTIEDFKGAQGESFGGGPFSWRESAENWIYKLGEGQGGGVVFRLVPKAGGTSKIIKHYHAASNLTNDLEAFRRIKSLYKGGEVKIAQHQRRGSRQMQLQDIKGQTLQDVLQYHLLPEEERDRLRNKYADFLFKLYSALQEKYSWRIISLDFNERDLFAMITMGHLAGKALKIYIKPDNFIVEEHTLDLYLIDPY